MNIQFFDAQEQHTTFRSEMALRLEEKNTLMRRLEDENGRLRDKANAAASAAASASYEPSKPL